MEYITDQDTYVQTAAENYIATSQEILLSQFLEIDMVKAEYDKLLNNANNPVHNIKKIISAVESSGAKTVNVTINKNGQEFRFKTEAEPLKRDPSRSYGTWNMAASDRREFHDKFGRGADYSPSEITQITYGKAVLYEAEPQEIEQEESTGMNMSM